MGQSLSFSDGLSLEFQIFLAILQFISWSCKVFRRAVLSFGVRLCSPHPFGAVPCSAALFSGGVELSARAAGALANAESTRDPGVIPAGGDTDIPVLLCLGRLKAGSDSGLHKTAGECSSVSPLLVVSPKRVWKTRFPWKTRCSLA